LYFLFVVPFFHLQLSHQFSLSFCTNTLWFTKPFLKPHVSDLLMGSILISSFFKFIIICITFYNKSLMFPSQHLFIIHTHCPIGKHKYFNYVKNGHNNANGKAPYLLNIFSNHISLKILLLIRCIGSLCFCTNISPMSSLYTSCLKNKLEYL
jgi:hypothetical protein